MASPPEPHGQAPRARITSPVSVARQAELEAALRALGSPSVILLGGEAGVGKTRLLGDVLAHPDLRGRRALVARCVPLLEPLPLGPIVGALRACIGDVAPELSGAAGVLVPLLPEAADRLPQPPEPTGDAAADRLRLFRACREVLQCAGPTLLAVEDLHWADELTVEFLRFLLTDQPDDLTVAITYRPEDLDRDSDLAGLISRLHPGVDRLHLTLEPLGPAAVGDLVCAILGTEGVTREFADYLHQRTAGLPFAVEEVIGLLLDREDIALVGGRWSRRALRELDVPPAIRDFVLERVARLPAPAAALVEAAAVLGRPSDDALIARTAGIALPQARPHLSAALEAGLLAEGSSGSLALRHELARDAVLEAIPGPRRRSLHLRAARALERRDPKPLAMLAHHYRQAGERDRWLWHAEAAADLAIELRDEAAAARLIEDALSADGLPLETRARLGLKLGRAALDGLRHDRAIDVLTGLVQETGLARPVRGELRFALAHLLAQSGDRSAAARQLATAAEELRARPALATRAMIGLAVPWLVEGTLEEHMRWLERVERAEATRSDLASRTRTTMNRAGILISVGDPEGWKVLSQVPPALEDEDHVRQLLIGYHNLAQATVPLGHHREAERFLQHARELEATHPFPRLAGALDSIALALALATGRWSDLRGRAEALLQEAQTQAVIDARTVLGLLDLAQGRGAERLETVVTEAARGGHVPALVAAAGGLARAALTRDDPERAAGISAIAMAVIAQKRIWVWGSAAAPVAVDALLAGGAAADAERLTRRFASGLRGRDAPAARAALAMCRASLARAAEDDEGAARAFDRAARAWERLPNPYEAARARVRLADALPEGDPRGAEALTRALETFVLLEAGTERDAARGALKARGIETTSAWRGGRRGYGDQLSPREEEVIRLVAQGSTNRQIAAALYLSPRTVERHIERAMRKLRVRSRAALAVTAAAREEAVAGT